MLDPYRWFNKIHVQILRSLSNNICGCKRKSLLCVSRAAESGILRQELLDILLEKGVRGIVAIRPAEWRERPVTKCWSAPPRRPLQLPRWHSPFNRFPVLQAVPTNNPTEQAPLSSLGSRLIIDTNTASLVKQMDLLLTSSLAGR